MKYSGLGKSINVNIVDCLEFMRKEKIVLFMVRNVINVINWIIFFLYVNLRIFVVISLEDRSKVKGKVVGELRR